MSAKTSGVLVLAASALALAGCSSGSTTSGHSPAPTSSATATAPAPKAVAEIQLRSVASSSQGVCREPLLLTAGSGRACSLDAEVTYQLGPTIADLVVTKARVADEDSGGVSTGEPIVRAQLDKTGTQRLSTVSKELMGKTVALLVGGRVVQAPIVRSQIKDGDVALIPGSSAAQPPTAAAYKRLLDEVATALGAQ